MSIVVTAVYILRAIARTAMGTLKEGFQNLSDATWNEKLSAIFLLAGILAIGLAPFWLNDLVRPAAEVIMQKITPIVIGTK
jgi:NADH-quinone oxidoreductase subunit M